MGRARLTAEDLRVLEFLAEHRVVIATQVEMLLGCEAPEAERRLGRLADGGLLYHEHIFEGYPAACRISRAGFGAIGRNRSSPQLNLKEYRHDVGLGWLWLAAEAGAFGKLDRIVGERAMRSSDRRERALSEAPDAGTYGIGFGGGGRLHYPDLLLETATGHRVAVELELTGKTARRLDRIMLGYAGERSIDAVLYLCPPGPLAGRVQAAARRAGISDLIHVQLLAPGSPGGAPDTGRMAARVSGRARVPRTANSAGRAVVEL